MKTLRLIFLLTFLSVSVFSQAPEKEILSNLNTAKNLIETDVSSAFKLAHSAFVTSRNNDYDRGIAESYLVVGRCYLQTGDMVAKKALNAALKFAEKIQDKALISDCYFYLGKSCFINGDVKSQLDYYHKAFEIRKEINDQKRLADSYHAYGNVHLVMYQDSLAEQYFNLSKEIRSMLHDRSGLAAICNNLGIIASRRGDTALYISLLYQAIQMNEEIGNIRNLSTNHGNLGVIYREQGNYDSAWFHCMIAFEKRKANGFKDHLCGSYTDLGKILFAQKKYTEALSYYKQGVMVAKSIEGTEWLIGNYESLAETYAALDSQPQRSNYEKLALDLKKQHIGDTLLTASIPLPMSFDFAEPKSEGSYWPWWVAGAIVLLGVGFVLYRRKA